MSMPDFSIAILWELAIVHAFILLMPSLWSALLNVSCNTSALDEVIDARTAASFLDMASNSPLYKLAILADCFIRIFSIATTPAIVTRYKPNDPINGIITALTIFQFFAIFIIRSTVPLSTKLTSLELPMELNIISKASFRLLIFPASVSACIFCILKNIPPSLVISANISRIISKGTCLAEIRENTSFMDTALFSTSLNFFANSCTSGIPASVNCLNSCPLNTAADLT